MDPHDTEARLMALELKLMDVERTVEALDAVVIVQAGDIERLRRERAALAARLEDVAKGLADGPGPGELPSPEDERPPHY